ncbi:MAG: hypothetical protein ACOCTH_00390, partial [Halodesulfurarchaeum sp.]
EWLQRVQITTFGRIYPGVYELPAPAFMVGTPTEGRHYDLDVLVTEAARDLDLDPEDVTEIRNRFWQRFIHPAYHGAAKSIRRNAGQYVDDDGERSPTNLDPVRQRYTGMRPALDELDKYQQTALGLLLDGFEEPSQIIDWIQVLELASQHEVPVEFGWRLYNREADRRMLCGESEAMARTRELVALRFILPMFTRGTKDLASYAREQPQRVRDQEVPTLG